VRPLFLLLITLPLFASAQAPPHSSFYAAIKDYDCSILWRADSILDEDNGQKAPFPEPLGYIGVHYQRFRIHYKTVRKSRTDPYMYEVTGETHVKENICPFTGTITIARAWLYKNTSKPPYKEGKITCAIRFYEDSAFRGSGAIEGTLSTDFCIDQQNQLLYDAIMLVADTYNNNQATTLWTSYRTGTRKICNWGDYRIPDSKELDTGAGIFMPDPKYKQYGWDDY
jgi:hypothetical protein